MTPKERQQAVQQILSDESLLRYDNNALTEQLSQLGSVVDPSRLGHLRSEARKRARRAIRANPTLDSLLTDDFLLNTDTDTIVAEISRVGGQITPSQVDSLREDARMKKANETTNPYRVVRHKGTNRRYGRQRHTSYKQNNQPGGGQAVPKVGQPVPVNHTPGSPQRTAELMKRAKEPKSIAEEMYEAELEAKKVTQIAHDLVEKEKNRKDEIKAQLAAAAELEQQKREKAKEAKEKEEEDIKDPLAAAEVLPPDVSVADLEASEDETKVVETPDLSNVEGINKEGVPPPPRMSNIVEPAPIKLDDPVESEPEVVKAKPMVPQVDHEQDEGVDSSDEVMRQLQEMSVPVKKPAPTSEKDEDEDVPPGGGFSFENM